MSAALQNQPPVVGAPPPMPQPAQSPEQITPEMLMEMFAIGEEEARRILEALPQLCGAAQPQLQQGAEIEAIQQGFDIQNFQSFLNFMNSPMVTDAERAWVGQLDTRTLFEVATKTGQLGNLGPATKDQMARIQWSDETKKNPTAKQIGEWLIEVLMPRVIQPLMQGQEQMGQMLTQLAQAEAMRQQAGAGQGIGMGGPPQMQGQGQGQGQNQRQMPWTNSKGDRVWYKMFQDSTGKKILMADSLQMTVDSIKIDDDGVLTGDAVMTAAMVQTYMKDGKEQKVLKDPGELQKACDAWLVGMPCADSHPEEGIVMNQDEIVGWTTPPQWDAENNNVKCQITITDGTAVKKIQDGNTDVSIGFFCDLDDSPGTFQDADYEAVQRNIVFNHLAVGLDKGNGRCPDGTCGIQIAAQEIDNCPGGDLCKCGLHRDQPRREEERAMSHFNITPEAWAKLSAEEKAAKISALPPRGSGDEAVKAGKYQLEPGRPDTHDHFVTLDAEGNGISTENDDHVHIVEAMEVQLAEGHSHGLLPQSSEEETPMSDEEKLKAEKDKAEKEAAEKKVAADKAAAEKAAEEPENKDSSEDEADTPAEKPDELDEASQYVADMIEAEHTKLVDAIMDRKPNQEREFYEKKSLDDLKELTEFLDSVAPVDNSISAGKRTASDSTKAIDDAYADVEEKVQSK